MFDNKLHRTTRNTYVYDPMFLYCVILPSKNI